MKKFNPEYDIPKLKNILIVITVIVWILVQIFHWTTVEFVSEAMVGLVRILASVPAWKEKKRGNAVFWLVLAICWFGLAVRSFIKFNI